MNKLLLSLLLVLSGITFSQGQIVALKAGPVVSKLDCHIPDLHETELNKGYTGVAAVAGIDYLIHKYWCLSTDLGYINSGGKGHTLVHGAEGDQDLIIKTNLHFVTFNTLIHLQYKFGEFIEPFIGIGPRLDYLAGYHEDAVMMTEFEEKGELNKWLYGAVAAAGVHFDLQHWVVGFEYQYNWDMNELVEFEEGEVHNSIALRCSPFLVTVGYHFSGGHQAGHGEESEHH